MSYTYEQRKRPQGRENTAPERTTAPGTGHNALMPGPAIPQSGPSFDLDGAMQARMKSTFGDLSAVRDYTPPVREQAPLQTGPYTGPVTHAVSGASPSPSAAGPMQAKKDNDDPNRGKAKRDILDDQTVEEGTEGYDTLDPKLWEERAHERSFFGKLFGSKRKFYKAKIDRRPWEMTKEELQQNRFNPNNVSGLADIQNSIGTAGTNITARPQNGVSQQEAQNGFNNRSAWMTFQGYSRAADDDIHTVDDSGKEWDMNEVDHTAFTNKLKNMSRMVRDYPELKGHIGQLVSLNQEEREQKKEEQKKDTTTDNQGNAKPKKLRQRLKRKKGKVRENIQPAPMEGYQPNMSWQQDDATDPGWVKDPKAKDDGGGTMVMTAGFINSYSSNYGHVLSINAGLEGSSNEARNKRKEINQALTDIHGTTLDYAANHELGHMLNYELIKELNKSKSGKNQVDPETGKSIPRTSERFKANREDARYHITASRLVEQALRDTMSPEDFAKLVRYEEDSLGEDEEWDPGVQLGEDEEWVTKDTDERFKKGQINLKASGLGATKNNRGYTTDYGATNAAEFFAEAFADVYQNGKDARPASIRLVQLYEEEMKNAQKANES